MLTFKLSNLNKQLYAPCSINIYNNNMQKCVLLIENKPNHRQPTIWTKEKKTCKYIEIPALVVTNKINLSLIQII